MANETPYFAQNGNDMYFTWDGHGSAAAQFFAGKLSGDNMKGAIRFSNVAINQNQTVQRAGLYFFDDNLVGSGTIDLNFQGIKESDTADFSGGSPFGRTRTTAVGHTSTSAGASSWDADVTSIVQEIVNQGGWSSGNHLAIVAENNSSSDGSYVADIFSDTYHAVLLVRFTNPNLTPTPTTLVAPTFPDLDDVGIKVSKPGVDVFTTVENDLLFTSRKDVLKVVAQGDLSLTANTERVFAHGLGYVPQALVYIRASGYSFECPRISYGTDPIAGGMNSWFSVDDTYLRINCSIDATAYYFIFRDPQAS